MRIWQCDRASCRGHITDPQQVYEIEAYRLPDHSGAPRCIIRNSRGYLWPDCYRALVACFEPHALWLASGSGSGWAT